MARLGTSGFIDDKTKTTASRFPLYYLLLSDLVPVDGCV